VFYIDSDIILLRDPIPYLNSIRGYDILAQADGSDICTGFMFIFPTNMSNCMMKKSLTVPPDIFLEDQAAIIIGRKYCEANHMLLPNTLFPSGRVFYSKYQYPWDILSIVNITIIIRYF
jgi:hypothetical protein